MREHPPHQQFSHDRRVKACMRPVRLTPPISQRCVNASILATCAGGSLCLPHSSEAALNRWRAETQGGCSATTALQVTLTVFSVHNPASVREQEIGQSRPAEERHNC
eukprot:6181535-Pleurochrysis_carterae.AAC.4